MFVVAQLYNTIPSTVWFAPRWQVAFITSLRSQSKQNLKVLTHGWYNTSYSYLLFSQPQSWYLPFISLTWLSTFIITFVLPWLFYYTSDFTVFSKLKTHIKKRLLCFPSLELRTVNLRNVLHVGITSTGFTSSPVVTGFRLFFYWNSQISQITCQISQI